MTLFKADWLQSYNFFIKKIKNKLKKGGGMIEE